MSVTNLAGTKWKFGDERLSSIPLENSLTNLNLNIIIGNTLCSQLNISINTTYEEVTSIRTNFEDYNVYDWSLNHPWDSEGYYGGDAHVWQIVGGEDATNSDLIGWLEINAIQVIQPIRPDFYKVTDLELTSVADAIRSAAGISESLTFPSGFISGIENAGGYCNISVDDYYDSMYTSVEAGVSQIGPGAFCRHLSLTTALFSKCTSIGHFTFYDCSSLATVSFPSCTFISNYAFGNCISLSVVSFPNCTSIGRYAFNRCYSLTTVFFPSCTSISDYAFMYCSFLTNISFPKCISIGYSAFRYCSSLTSAYFPGCFFIANYAFGNCYNLISLNLTNVSEVTSLPFSTAFSSTPIAGYTTSTGGAYGSIYVPSSLLTSFKTATNWTYFSDRMVGV